MIFIEKVELKNFQSHENTLLEFHRGLNVIIGHSDSGKTAIIRAIKWAIYNEPLGDYFLRQGQGEVSVTITFNTGAIVKRYRKSNKNVYYLKRSDGEEFTFEGFGTKVPKEISDEIKMSKINLDEKSSTIINIAEQLEGPFLLNDKGSVRASAIGRLVGVNYIDDALRDTLRDSKQINSNLKNMIIQKDKLLDELKEYDYLDDMKSKIDKLNKIKLIIEEKENKLKFLKSFKEQYDKSKEEISNNINLLNKFKDLDKLSNIINIIEIKSKELNSYISFKNNYYLCNSEILNNQKLLSKFSNLEFIDEKIKVLENKTIKLSTLNKVYDRYNASNREINYNENILTKYKYLDNANANLEKLNIYIQKYNKLFELNDKFTNISSSINIGQSYIKNFININKLDSSISMIEEKIRKEEFLKDRYRQILDIQKEIFKNKELENNISKQINLQIANYNEMLKKLGYCPLCLSKIDDNTINHLLEHFKE